jgi:catechol 2,3-dioxygenase-like lactoylglutathione lyase family enzyme
MAEDHRPGATYWVDHYVIGNNDLERSVRFYADVMGAEPRRANGAPLKPEERARTDSLFLWVGTCAHLGTYVQPEPLPGTKGLGVALPRYGWFIRPEEIDDHLRRLDYFQTPHTDPVRTSAEGQPGIAIYWEDPDGNQLEFWAPDHLPEGAMTGEGPLHVGRISSAVFECRDLARATDFYERWCTVDPIVSADVPRDTSAFALAGGGRLVLKQVESLGTRTAGHAQWRVLHTAFTLRDDEFIAACRRMWAALPEWDFDPRVPRVPNREEEEALPARTGVHGMFGLEWKQAFGRGDSFYDWDTNVCHYYPGGPIDGSMATHTIPSMRSFYEQASGA